MDQTSSRQKVCMVVWNDFRHDARVTKEAETLTQAGWDVVVIAIHSPGKTRLTETHTSGFRVIRVFRGFRKQNRREGAVSPAPANASGGHRKNLVQRLCSSLGRRLRLVALPIVRIPGHKRIFSTIRQERPAVVHAHDVNTLITAWLAARSVGAKLVYDAHEISTDREGYKGVAWGVRVVERLLAPRAAFMITTTDMRADHFADEYPVSRPLVLQNRPRRQEAPRSNRLREIYSLPAGRPIVLYQGGLQSGRGLRNLVRVAAKVSQADFVLLGWGRQEPELKALISKLGLDSRVHVHPGVPLDELPSYTASATVGVQLLRNTCLNHYTTDSNKLFEYIMAGLPVVASDFPEIRKIVTQYEVGMVVDPDDLDGIAAALIQLLSSPEQLVRYRANALNAASVLSWEAQEDVLVSAYSRLARGA